MGVLEDLASVLEADGQGTSGSDLFLNFMGETPDALAALYGVHVGDAPLETFGNGTLPAVDTMRVQARTRAAEYDVPAAEAAIDALWKRLVRITNEDINGTRYFRVWKHSGPFMMDIDHNDRPIFAVNLVVEFIP